MPEMGKTVLLLLHVMAAQEAVITPGWARGVELKRLSVPTADLLCNVVDFFPEEKFFGNT